MTHTLHRQGGKEGLQSDYVILVMTERGYNTNGAREKLQSICDILAQHDPVNMGDMEGGRCLARGDSVQEIRASLKDFAILHGVYSTKKQVDKILHELKESDFGISVVISGLFEKVFSLLNKDKPPFPHTVNLSLGIHGNLDLLPKEEILEIATMCGHGLVSRNLIQHQIENIREGNSTPEKAAVNLSKRCVCGIFNKERARDLLEKYAAM